MCCIGCNKSDVPTIAGLCRDCWEKEFREL